MNAPALPADTAEFRQHWRTVAGAAVGLGFGVSIWSGVGSLFVLPMTQEFGWTRGQLAQLSAVSLVTAFITPLVGLAADRFGVRVVAVVSYILLGAGYMVLSQLHGSLWLYAASLLLMGIAGIGTTAITWARPLVARFYRQRGLALGLAFAGVSISGILIPPVIQWVIDNGDWRRGFMTLGALVWGIGLVAALLTLRHEPRVPLTRVMLSAAPSKWGPIFRTPAFWLLLVAMFLVNLGGSGLIGQLVPLLSDRGLRASDGALLLSLYSASILAGRVTTGFLLDRVNPPYVAAVAMLIPAVGCLMLAEASLGLALAAFAVVLIGVSQGAETDVLGFMTARYLGQTHYSALLGVYFGAVVSGNAVGTVFIGRSFDATGSYVLALTIFAGCFAVGAAAFAGLRWCQVVEGRVGATLL